MDIFFFDLFMTPLLGANLLNYRKLSFIFLG